MNQQDVVDGAFLDNLKISENEDLILNQLRGDTFRLFLCLMQGQMKIESYQSLEQTERHKGEYKSIIQFIDQGHNGHYKRGWSDTFYKILITLELNSLANRLRPSDEKLRDFEEKCGRTGCELLNRIEEKIKEDFSQLNSEDSVEFRLYHDDCNVAIQRNGITASSRYDQVDVTSLIESVRNLKGERKKRLHVSVDENNPSINFPMSDFIAREAVKQNLICLRFSISDIDNTEQYKSEDYCIQQRLSQGHHHHHRVENNEQQRQVRRAFNYVVNHPEETLIILDLTQELDCPKFCRRVTVLQNGCFYEPKAHLHSILAKDRFIHSPLVIISRSSKKITKCFQTMLPEMFASYTVVEGR